MQDITLNRIEKIFLVIWIRDISTPATGTVQRSKVFLIFSLRVPLFVFCFFYFTKYYLEFNSTRRDSFSVEKLSSWRKKERGRCEWWILDPLDQLQEFSGCSNSIMSSVTRWLNYLFNIWPFPTMSSWTTAYLENWPKYVHNFAQYWIHHRKNYKILLIFLPEWQNSTKYGHTDLVSTWTAESVCLSLSFCAADWRTFGWIWLKK